MRKLIVIGLFLVMILSPLLGSFLGIRSESKENRALADMPPISVGALLDKDIYPKIENFYNDHFAFRGWLIKSKNWVDYRIFRVSPSSQVHIGKDGWLFLKETIPSYLKVECGEKESMRTLAKQLHDMERITQSSGKEFYFIVAPNKATIYPEHVGIERPDTGCGKSRYDLLLEAFSEYPVNGFIRLDELLIRAKGERQLYFKTDTHWNGAGTAIAAKTMLRNISRFTENSADTLKIKFSHGTHRGDLSNMLGISMDAEETDSSLIVDSFGISVIEIPLKNRQPYLKYTSKPPSGTRPLPRIFIYRDSFMNYPLELLKGLFEETDVIWPFNGGYDNIPASEKIELEDLPESKVVLVEVVERYLGYLVIDTAKYEATLKDTARTQILTAH